MTPLAGDCWEGSVKEDKHGRQVNEQGLLAAKAGAKKGTVESDAKGLFLGEQAMSGLKEG